MPTTWVKTGNATWTNIKSIFVKTTSSFWTEIQSAWVKTGASTWTKVFAGLVKTPSSVTSPYIASSSSSTTPLTDSTVLRIGTTIYGKNGTWNNNGYTITNYQYRWRASTTFDGSSGVTNGTLTTWASPQSPVSLSVDGTTYDSKYISFLVRATNSQGYTEAESGNGYGWIRCVRYPPVLAAGGSPALDNYAPKVGDIINYSSGWNTTDAYKIDAARSKIVWYKNFTGLTSGGTSIQDSTSSPAPTSPYSYTVQTSDIGYYIYAVETVYNSGSDYDYGTNVGVEAKVVTTTTAVAAPTPGTVTLSTDTGNWSAGSVITITPTNWNGYASYAYKLYYSSTSPVTNTSGTKTLTGTNGNQYTITAVDATASSYYFRGEIIGYTGANKTGTASAAILSDTSPISTLVPTSTISVDTATANGFTVSGTASASGVYGYASVDAILIYDVYQNLYTTITTGLPTVSSTTGNWSYIWSGGSSSSTYYAKVRIKASDTSGTLFTSGFSSSITTLAPAPSSFYFYISNSGTVTQPYTPSITRVSGTSNIVLFELGSSFASDTYQYGVNQSGAAFGSRTGTPAQTVTTLNQWDANGNFGSGIYDTISTIEPGSNNAAMTISTTAYGKTRSANANVSTTSGASSWAINFSWSNATSGSVTYYSNGVGFTSSSTAATVTVYTNSMPVKIADVTGTSDPTITINSMTAYSNSNQTGSTTGGASGVAYGYKISDIFLRPTSTSGSTTSFFTYYDPTPYGGSVSISTNTGNWSAGSVITVSTSGWTNAASYKYELYAAGTVAGITPATGGISKTLNASNQYTITYLDATNISYYFKGRVVAYSGSGQTGFSASAESSASPQSYIIPSTSISVSGATTNGFTISGTASPVQGGSAYVSISAIRIYNSSLSLITTITSGLPSVNTSSGAWSYTWTGGSSSTTYYAQATARATDTALTTADSGFAGPITTTSSFVTPTWTGSFPSWTSSNFQRVTSGTANFRWGWGNGTFTWSGSTSGSGGWDFNISTTQLSTTATRTVSVTKNYTTSNDTYQTVNSTNYPYLVSSLRGDVTYNASARWGSIRPWINGTDSQKYTASSWSTGV